MEHDREGEDKNDHDHETPRKQRQRDVSGTEVADESRKLRHATLAQDDPGEAGVERDVPRVTTRDGSFQTHHEDGVDRTGNRAEDQDDGDTDAQGHVVERQLSEDGARHGDHRSDGQIDVAHDHDHREGQRDQGDLGVRRAGGREVQGRHEGRR